MKTEIVSAQECAKAISLLREGEVVALPTETVYGLAADALNPDAVVKVFEAKQRPHFDPLIVHLPIPEASDEIAIVESKVAHKLMGKFWPGPLTIIFPKRAIVPEIVTAGLDTVAVRMSAHPIFREVVRELKRTLAAPSANRFGRISPTTAQHVFDELSGRIPLIVDGGATEHGIESTIVQVADDTIEVLRRGPVTDDMLREFAEVRTRPSGDIIAPGQLPSHYAPTKPLYLVDDAESFSPASNQRCGLLAWKASKSGGFPTAVSSGRRSGDRRSLAFAAVRRLSEKQDLREAAANFFRMLRELDNEDLDLIVVERVPEEGIGAAINDRLRRAATN